MQSALEALYSTKNFSVTAERTRSLLIDARKRIFFAFALSQFISVGSLQSIRLSAECVKPKSFQINKHVESRSFIHRSVLLGSGKRRQAHQVDSGSTFCVLQISLTARIVEKRDAVDVSAQTTTESSFFQSIKTGLENTFTKERFDVRYCAFTAKSQVVWFNNSQFQKVKDSISTGASHALNYTTVGFNKAKDGVTNLLKKDEVPSTVSPPAVAA